jgi:hypothetical protein
MVPMLPFGMYKGLSLTEVPDGYLAWLLREVKLSSGLHNAVTNELTRRGVSVPAPPPPRPPRRCYWHPNARPVLRWDEDSLGRRSILATCPVCDRLVDRPPRVPPYTTEADAHASSTPVLDVLVKLDEMNVELYSDGRTAWGGGQGRAARATRLAGHHPPVPTSTWHDARRQPAARRGDVFTMIPIASGSPALARHSSSRQHLTAPKPESWSNARPSSTAAYRRSSRRGSLEVAVHRRGQ